MHRLEIITCSEIALVVPTLEGAERKLCSISALSNDDNYHLILKEEHSEHWTGAKSYSSYSATGCQMSHRLHLSLASKRENTFTA